MKNFKKAIAIGTMVLTIGAVSAAAMAASSYSTPAEAVAGLTGRTVDSVVSERADSGNTYGTIASDAGVLDQFKAEMLEIKRDRLNARVEAGTLTQEQADAIIKAVEENQATCDGTGGARIGQAMGAGFGAGNGTGRGMGTGQGAGNGGGRGQGAGGMGLRDGSCLNQ